MLDDKKNIISTTDIEVWGKYFETADRHIGLTVVGNARVSTVFLGIDHSYRRDEKVAPLLFETMVFNSGEKDEIQLRYATLDQAKRGHKKIVALMQSKIGKKNENK
jgi:hypothetical protein